MDSFPVFLIHSFSEHRRVVTKPKQANTCWSEKKFCFLVYLSQLLRIKSNSMSNESSLLLWYQQLLHRKTLLFHSKSSVFVFFTMHYDTIIGSSFNRVGMRKKSSLLICDFLPLVDFSLNFCLKL